MSTILEVGDWSAFKALCIQVKNLNCQFVDALGLYDLYGPDANGLVWHANIPKTVPASVDQADFETNYKAQAFNFAIGSRPYPFSTPDFEFSGDGAVGTAAKGQATNIDFVIPGGAGTSMYIDGGNLITQNAAFGDWIEAQIIDVTNVLGLGANTVLSQYVTKWFVDPSSPMVIKTSYAGKIPAGIYIRIIYHSVGTVNDVDVAINYFLHTPL